MSPDYHNLLTLSTYLNRAPGDILSQKSPNSSGRIVSLDYHNLLTLSTYLNRAPGDILSHDETRPIKMPHTKINMLYIGLTLGVTYLT